MRRVVFLLVICAFGRSAVAQEVLTLEEAVRLAKENNYAIRMAKNEARIAENDYSLGNAGFLPQLNLRAQQSRSSFGSFSGGGGSSGSANTLDLSMNVSTTIFDGGERFATYRRLGSEMEERILSAERTAESTLAEVVISYYDLVRLQEQTEVQQEAVGISEERLRIAELRRDLGSASELEVRRARVDLNADRGELLRQQVALANARAEFNQLIAREGGLDYQVADTIRIDLELDVASLRADALERNTTLTLARQARTTAGLVRSEVRADWLPRIDLTAGYAFNDLTSDLGLTAGRPSGFNYGITAAWDIFDGFNRERRLQNARLLIRNSELAIEEVRNEVDVRFATAHQDFRNSLQLVDLERENVALAAFNVDLALEQFRLGTITSVELREVQSASTNAELRFITAQFEAARAWIELLLLSGTLADTLEAGI